MLAGNLYKRQGDGPDRSGAAPGARIPARPGAGVAAVLVASAVVVALTRSDDEHAVAARVLLIGLTAALLAVAIARADRTHPARVLGMGPVLGLAFVSLPLLHATVRPPRDRDPAVALAAAEVIPPEAVAALQRARELHRRQEPLSAAAELEHAIRLAPAWAEAHRALGQLLYSLSAVCFATPTLDRARLKLAIAELVQAHALDPDDAEGAFWAGRALALGRRFDEAECMLLDVLELDPSHGPACKELALLYAGRGETKRARPRFERAAELLPEDDEVLFHLGLQLEAEEELVAAGAAYRRALALNPGHLGPRARLAALHERLGEHAEALRTVAELERWKAFGLRLKRALDRGVESPGDAPAALAVGELYLEAGMRTPARDWFLLARERDPANPEAARRLRELGAPASPEAAR